MSDIEWLSEDSFEIRGVTFCLSIVGQSTSDRFVLAKPRHMVDRYEALIASLCPKRIIELGIYEGGSAAFLHLLARPERLVAMDITAEPVPQLEAFVEQQGLQDRMHTCYGFDQADDARLRELIEREFAGEPIDLVVDDASHRLGPTRASFNVLFPRLRPGGVYVVEDWSGLHHFDAALRVRAETDRSVRARLEAHVRERRVTDTPLSVLLFELVLASAYAPSVFSEVVVADGWASVIRGPGELDPAVFDLSQVYSDTARALLARTS